MSFCFLYDICPIFTKWSFLASRLMLPKNLLKKEIPFPAVDLCQRLFFLCVFMIIFDNHCSKFLHYDCCHCWGSYSLCFVVFSSWNKRRYIKAHYLPEDLKDECFLTSLPSGQFLFSKVQLPTSWMVTSKINSTFQQALLTVVPWGWNGILFTFLLDSW